MFRAAWAQNLGRIAVKGYSPGGGKLPPVATVGPYTLRSTLDNSGGNETRSGWLRLDIERCKIIIYEPVFNPFPRTKRYISILIKNLSSRFINSQELNN